MHISKDSNVSLIFVEIILHSNCLNTKEIYIPILKNTKDSMSFFMSFLLFLKPAFM